MKKLLTVTAAITLTASGSHAYNLGFSQQQYINSHCSTETLQNWRGTHSCQSVARYQYKVLASSAAGKPDPNAMDSCIRGQAGRYSYEQYMNNIGQIHDACYERLAK